MTLPGEAFIDIFIEEVLKLDSDNGFAEQAAEALAQTLLRFTAGITITPLTTFTIQPVVYYVRRRDGAVKIGYSAYPAVRFKQLTQRHGPLEALAYEVGSEDLEARRHGQFHDLRIDARAEWFHPGATLLHHIALLNSAAQALARR